MPTQDHHSPSHAGERPSPVGRLTKQDWKRIAGEYKHKGQTICIPIYPTHGFEFDWKPEPFFAVFTDEGLIPHPEIENPHKKVFVAASISTTQFYRHCKYYRAPKEGRRGGVFDNFKHIVTEIYIVQEQNDKDLYCVAVWKGITFLFGKLLRTSPEYKLCRRAMRNMTIANIK